jgi:hypothetical protein
MRTLAWKAVLLILFLAIGAAVSLLLLATIIGSAIVTAIIRRVPRQTAWARPFWYAILIIGLLAAWKWVKPHPRTCEASPSSFFGRGSTTSLESLTRLPSDPDADFRGRIESECLDLLQHATAARKSGLVLNSARRTLELSAGDISGEDSAKLAAAISALQQSIDKLNRNKFSVRMEKLNNFVEAQRRAIADTIANNRDDFLDEFERTKTNEEWSFEDTYSKMVVLQDLLSRFVNSKVKDDLGTDVALSARLEESKNTVAYYEKIGVTLGNGVVLDQLDVSNLMVTATFKRMDQSLLLGYDDAPPSKIDVGPTKTSIVVPNGVRSITLVNELRTSANLTQACTSFRVFGFRRFDLRWPNASNGSIGLQLTLTRLGTSNGNHPLPYLAKIDIKKDNPVSDVEIPRYSYFSSDYAAKEDRGRPTHIAPDPPLAAAASATSQPMVIELLPPLFRNSVVQEAKQFLFPLNAVVALTFALIGCLFEILVDPKK